MRRESDIYTHVKKDVKINSNNHISILSVRNNISKKVVKLSYAVLHVAFIKTCCRGLYFHTSRAWIVSDADIVHEILVSPVSRKVGFSLNQLPQRRSWPGGRENNSEVRNFSWLSLFVYFDCHIFTYFSVVPAVCSLRGHTQHDNRLSD